MQKALTVLLGPCGFPVLLHQRVPAAAQQQQQQRAAGRCGAWAKPHFSEASKNNKMPIFLQVSKTRRSF
jgi:hypothetical protein